MFQKLVRINKNKNVVDKTDMIQKFKVYTTIFHRLKKNTPNDELHCAKYHTKQSNVHYLTLDGFCVWARTTKIHKLFMLYNILF